MFLKETTVRSGGRSYVYVQLVQGYRDEHGRVRQRVVANLGRKEKLKASGELDRLAVLPRHVANTADRRSPAQ